MSNKELGFFDIINDIIQHRKGIFQDGKPPKGYSQFPINRMIARYPDCRPVVSLLNQYKNVDDLMHYEFLNAYIKPKKRFSRIKKDPKSDTPSVISNIIRHWQVSEKESYQILDMLDDDGIEWVNHVYSNTVKKQNKIDFSSI